MASLIETRLTTAASMIAGIRAGQGADSPSAGYNFDWSEDGVNQFDLAQVPEGPFARMRFDPIIIPDDQGNGGDCDPFLYQIVIDIGFKFGVKKTILEAQFVIMRAFDDIRRLFGRDLHLAASGGGVNFSLSPRRFPEFRYQDNNQLSPVSHLETLWVTPIRANRLNPDLRAA